MDLRWADARRRSILRARRCHAGRCAGCEAAAGGYRGWDCWRPERAKSISLASGLEHGHSNYRSLMRWNGLASDVHGSLRCRQGGETPAALIGRRPRRTVPSGAQATTWPADLRRVIIRLLLPQPHLVQTRRQPHNSRAPTS
jgi:hypothetical protein